MHWTLLLIFLNQHKQENITSLLLTTESLSNNILFELRWNLFKVNHLKRYDTPDEYRKRKAIFSKTLQQIDSHNFRFKRGLETFEMGVNQFSDITDEEFEAFYVGNEVVEDDKADDSETSSIHDDDFNKEYEFNWYTPAIPVKDQKKCGSCFTFATTGLLEYDYYYKEGKVVSLSEQELLDCVQEENYGCNGGQSYFALMFVQKNGINYEKDYPYKQQQSNCKIREKKMEHIIKGIKQTERSEKSILQSLANSPLIVRVYANTKVWKNYKTGFITAKSCEQKKINHAIVLLGVVKENGQKLWYARNSFGATWGIKGHLKLEMNKNTCKIGQTKGYYVTV